MDGLKVFRPLGVCLVLAFQVGPTDAPDRILRAEVVVPASLEQVWNAWTTESGIRTFFAPDARVDLRVDGLYEILFNPAAPVGQRGSEGMRILDLEPMTRFAFTWSAPPHLPRARAQRTEVILEFTALGDKTTRLRLTHLGWGQGGEWDQAYAYFDHAWCAVVLPAFKYRFEKGPIDWIARPQLAPIADSIAVELAPSGS